MKYKFINNLKLKNKELYCPNTVYSGPILEFEEEDLNLYKTTINNEEDDKIKTMYILNINHDKDITVYFDLPDHRTNVCLLCNYNNIVYNTIMKIISSHMKRKKG